MKISGLIAAGLLAVGAMVPASAVAAPSAASITLAGAHTTSRHVVVRERTVTRSGPSWRGGNRWGNRRVCENRWRNGHRVRVCRTVRYRR